MMVQVGQQQLISNKQEEILGAGTQTAALGFGGYTACYQLQPEEFTGAALTVKTITTS
jgi:hypothetical protein